MGVLNDKFRINILFWRYFIMKAKGDVALMGTSLTIAFEDKDWSIQIRKRKNKSKLIDDKPNFFEFHDKDMTKEQIKMYIPNPEQLEFTKTKELDLGAGLKAVDNGYEIYLIPTKKNMTTEKMKEEFLELLR
jgi:hypothetical protein